MATAEKLGAPRPLREGFRFRSSLVGIFVHVDDQVWAIQALRRAPRFSVDWFGIVVGCPTEMTEAVRQCFRDGRTQDIRL